MTADSTYRALSYWHDTVPGPLDPRPPLEGSFRVDVAIVGAGFSGLWTAYSLAVADPTLRIAVVEREIAGFGASGRNGGWVSAAFPVAKPELVAACGRDATIAMQRTLFDTVDEVGRTCEAEAIDAHYRKGGSLGVATLQPEADRFKASLEEDLALGFDDGDWAWLTAEEASRHVRVAGAIGALWTPHNARVHPARLARGLADAAERRGVQIFEGTAVRSVEGRIVRADRGRLRADVVVLATEGYGARLGVRRRAVAPVYSYMAATEPLPASFWDAVGWAGYACVWDGPRLYLYAQRTEDDRVAIGGGAIRYPFASRVRPSFDRPERIFRQIRRIIGQRWPAASDARITHSWGGALGVARDWFPSVGLDRGTGIAWAGGYAGDGVAAANLAGRTLRDLILDRDTDLVHLPWTGHRSPPWEPEPLRWLGVAGSWGLASLADRVEARTGRAPAALDTAMERLRR
ncbi:MAG: NAD(P)/FAD-dependent oxidoreductase [Planctomycetaceae bacterium]